MLKEVPHLIYNIFKLQIVPELCAQKISELSKLDKFIVASIQEAPFDTSIYFLSTWPSEAEN